MTDWSSVDSSVPVVVLNVGDHGALGIARSLGRIGVAVHGVHDGSSPAATSRYFRSVRQPPGRLDEPGLLRYLVGLAAAWPERPVLIPTGDDMALRVEEWSDELRPHYRLPQQPAGLAAALSSKAGMHDLCRQHGIPTPETAYPKTRAEVDEWLAEPTFPVMVKAIDGTRMVRRSGVNMVRVDSASQLIEAYERLQDPQRPNVMLQEYIPGDATAIWMFDGYFGAGGCSFGITGQKLRQCPPTTGSASLAVVVENETVQQVTRTFMAALGYRGILDCGYRFDQRDGTYKLLDVNPRIGATFRLFVDDDGMDVARALYLDLTGQPVSPGRTPEGRRWLVENNDILSYLEGRATGGPTLGPWLRSWRGVDERAWWDPLDPAPGAAIAWKSFRGRLRRSAKRAH